jgi:hypothetical protein
MINENLAFWFDLLGSSTAILGIFIVAYELYKARKAEIRQFHFDTFKMFTIDMREDRLAVSDLHWANPEELITKISGDRELFHSFKNILDFYTLIASAARAKTIDRNKAIEYWGQPIISYWQRYGQILAKSRERFGPATAENLEWFYNISIKTYPYLAENIKQIVKEKQNINTDNNTESQVSDKNIF